MTSPDPDLQPPVDPWEDTTAERPIEHQDPFDDGAMEGPFGTMSEAAGVPRMSAGSRRPSSHRLLPRPVAQLLVAIIVLVVVVTAITWIW